MLASVEVTVGDPVLVQNFSGLVATLRSFDQVKEQRQPELSIQQEERGQQGADPPGAPGFLSVRWSAPLRRQSVAS